MRPPEKEQCLKIPLNLIFIVSNYDSNFEFSYIKYFIFTTKMLSVDQELFIIFQYQVNQSIISYQNIEFQIFRFARSQKYLTNAS